MKISLLFTSECPNLSRTLALVQTALQQTNTDAEVELVQVDTEEHAREVRFLGSPTVRVDGVDVEARATFERQDFGLSCRLYRHPSGLLGYPPLDDIVETLEVGRLVEQGRLGRCC